MNRSRQTQHLWPHIYEAFTDVCDLTALLQGVEEQPRLSVYLGMRSELLYLCGVVCCLCTVKACGHVITMQFWDTTIQALFAVYFYTANKVSLKITLHKHLTLNCCFHSHSAHPMTTIYIIGCFSVPVSMQRAASRSDRCVIWSGDSSMWTQPTFPSSSSWWAERKERQLRGTKKWYYVQVHIKELHTHTHTHLWSGQHVILFDLYSGLNETRAASY